MLRILPTCPPPPDSAGPALHPQRVAEPSAAIRDATFLAAILPYALAQAERHHEPLTVFLIEIDRRPALLQTYGAEAAASAVRRLAVAIARTLRSSDVVARLDDDRVVVVLPNTGGVDAWTVAGVTRAAIFEACQPVDGLPALTASLGLACYPGNGRDMSTLLASADEAMTRARVQGPYPIASLSPIVPSSTPETGPRGTRPRG